MARREFTPEEAQYWGVIRSAGANRLTTAQLWDRIKEFEQNRGITRPASMFTAVSSMRSLATQARTASASLTGADEQTVIGAQHISPEINARPLNEFQAAPKYIVRFGARVTTAGGEARRWLSMIFHGSLPGTKGDLMRFLTLQAPALGFGYGELISGTTGDVEITAA